MGLIHALAWPCLALDHELGGADYDGLLRLDRETPADYLPPFAEIVKTARLARRPAAELREISLAQARRHLARRPCENPFSRYAGRLARDVDFLLARDPRTYHLYSFASIRQFGSAAELAASYVRWLSADGGPSLGEAAEDFAAISQTAKALILKLARIVHSGTPAVARIMNCCRAIVEPVLPLKVSRVEESVNVLGLVAGSITAIKASLMPPIAFCGAFGVVRRSFEVVRPVNTTRPDGSSAIEKPRSSAAPPR